MIMVITSLKKRWAYKTTPRHSKYIRPLLLKWVSSDSPEIWRVEY